MVELLLIAAAVWFGTGILAGLGLLVCTVRERMQQRRPKEELERRAA